MGEAALIRRMKSAGSANDLEPDEADDLFAPEFLASGHGFAVGDILRRTSATAHTGAQADIEANIGVELKIVCDVEDVDNFSAWLTRHAVTVASHGLTGGFGTKIYLSQSVAGAMTTTAPSSGLSLELGHVIDDDTIFFDPQPVQVI